MITQQPKMERCLYELIGTLEYFEQMTLLTGKIIIYNKPDDDKYYIIGRIIETLKNKEYYVEGEISDLSKIKEMALDFIETPLNIDSTTSFYITKDYSHIKGREVLIEGKFKGIKREDMVKDLLEDDSLPLENRVRDMVTNLTKSIDQKNNIVTISLKYKGLISSNFPLKEVVPPNFSF